MIGRGGGGNVFAFRQGPGFLGEKTHLITITPRKLQSSNPLEHLEHNIANADIGICICFPK